MAEFLCAKPKLILGCDGGQNKLVVNAIIKENDDTDDEESILEHFKATGSKRVQCLGKIDGVPETRENVEVLPVTENCCTELYI